MVKIYGEYVIKHFITVFYHGKNIPTCSDRQWQLTFSTFKLAENATSTRRLCKILIRVDFLLVRCWTHVASLRRSYALCAARIYT